MVSWYKNKAHCKVYRTVIFPLRNGDTPTKFVTTTEETLVYRANNIFSLLTYQTS